MRAAFISNSDCGRHDTGWGHPEHVGRLRAITRALREDPEFFHGVEHLEGRHATIDELELVHDTGYIRGVKQLAQSGGGRLDADTVTSSGSWEAATAGAGCILSAVDLSVAGVHPRSFCAVRPPGHHAVHNRSMGFCLFGNVALAAHYARKKHGLQRILILDWDVHHGNGTQALVQKEPDIHFVSMHQWPWYPGTGAAEDRGPHGTVWNVPKRPGLPRAEYVTAFESAIDAATRGFVPDLILISAGFDSLAGDPLGGFTLEVDDFESLTTSVVERADSWCHGRVVSALEGGYAPDRLAQASIRHLAALAA
ncbi:MAG TPA: histone deacetylase [Gemmatimonadaceae bacterium]|nr:histone deacetylase [Gemmatimonadaceae bacterium]